MNSRIPGNRSEALDDAIERICFLEWRIEQLEANLADARDKNRDLRGELSAATRARAAAEHEQASLTDALAEARREAEVLEERLALAERDRASARSHEHRVQGRMRQTTQALEHALHREQARAESSAQTLSETRARLDVLERAQAQFFARIDEWQRLLGTDPDRIDLAELIAELRGEVMRLAESRELGLARETELRLALVEARAPEAQAAPEAVEPGLEAPEVDRTELPAPALEAETTETPESRSTLRAALKARLTYLDDEDTRQALEAVPERLRARAQDLAQEIFEAAEDRALAAARGLAAVAPEAASAAIAARLRAPAADREAWLQALARTSGPLAVQAATRHLHDEEWTARGAAVEALLQIAPDEARLHLAGALDDADARVRRRAALAARARLGKAADDLLSGLLEDPCPRTRRLAATLLGGAVAQRHARANSHPQASARARPRRTTPWST